MIKVHQSPIVHWILVVSSVVMSFLNDAEELTELETRTADLELQLAHQEAKANATILQWQESHRSELARCIQLEQELETLKELADGSQSLTKDRLSSSSHAADFFGDGGRSVGSPTPEHGIPQLSEDIRNTDEELQKAKILLKDKDDIIRNWQDRAIVLDKEIVHLRSQVGDKEEAKKAISQWQDAHAEMEKRCIELESEIQDIKNNATDSDQTRYVNMEAEISTLRSELEAAQKALETDQEVVGQWEVRVEELEATVASMSNQMEDKQREAQEQEEEAEKAISQWQDAHAEMEKRCIELESEIQDIKNNATDSDQTRYVNMEAEISTLRSELEAAQKALETDQEVVGQWEVRVEELEATVASLSSELTEARAFVENLTEQIECERCGLKEARDEIGELVRRLEESQMELDVVVGQWRRKCWSALFLVGAFVTILT